MINPANERVWVKFHFRTQQGIANLTDEEAAAIVANDRESHGRDLFESIERGDFPRWTLFIQVMTDTQAKAFRSEEHTSELQSLMRKSYAVFCWKKINIITIRTSLTEG